MRYLWSFVVGFKSKSLIVNEWEHFELFQKQVFSAWENGAFSSFVTCLKKLSFFEGLLWPDHLTYNDLWGIIRNMRSISINLLIFFLNWKTYEATLVQRKIGLIWIFIAEKNYNWSWVLMGVDVVWCSVQIIDGKNDNGII